MKKLLAALVFVGFLTSGVATPIGITFDGGKVTVAKSANAQTTQSTKPEEQKGKKGKPEKKKTEG
jgi:hypothetical protein